MSNSYNVWNDTRGRWGRGGDLWENDKVPLDAKEGQGFALKRLSESLATALANQMSATFPRETFVIKAIGSNGEPIHANVTVSSNTAINAPAINNHTCPTCRNDRCSKTEKSCWKCGSKL